MGQQWPWPSSNDHRSRSLTEGNGVEGKFGYYRHKCCPGISFQLRWRGTGTWCMGTSSFCRYLFMNLPSNPWTRYANLTFCEKETTRDGRPPPIFCIFLLVLPLDGWSQCLQGGECEWGRGATSWHMMRKWRFEYDGTRMVFQAACEVNAPKCLHTTFTNSFIWKEFL